MDCKSLRGPTLQVATCGAFFHGSNRCHRTQKPTVSTVCVETPPKFGHPNPENLMPRRPQGAVPVGIDDSQDSRIFPYTKPFNRPSVIDSSEHNQPTDRMAAAAAANNNQPPHPMMVDNRQWRIVWTDPDEPAEEDTVSRFHQAWAIAVAPARIERDPAWLVPDRAFVWDSFADPELQTLIVASHNDGRVITLTRL